MKIQSSFKSLHADMLMDRRASWIWSVHFFKHFVTKVHNALCQLIKICVVHKQGYIVSDTSEQCDKLYGSINIFLWHSVHAWDTCKMRTKVDSGDLNKEIIAKV